MHNTPERAECILLLSFLKPTTYGLKCATAAPAAAIEVYEQHSHRKFLPHVQTQQRCGVIIETN